MIIYLQVCYKNSNHTFSVVLVLARPSCSFPFCSIYVRPLVRNRAVSLKVNQKVRHLCPSAYTFWWLGKRAIDLSQIKLHLAGQRLRQDAVVHGCASPFKEIISSSALYAKVLPIERTYLPTTDHSTHTPILKNINLLSMFFCCLVAARKTNSAK